MFKHALLLSLLAASPVAAETVKWARVADALSLDPHATNQAVTANFLHHIYETLVDTDDAGKVTPRLATEWFIKPDDNKVWVFKLRPGVKFHDGSAFTAEDVVFSLNRARSEGSMVRSFHSTVVDVVAVNDLTVEVRLSGPSPIYPNYLTNTFIMDRTWSEKNNVVKVQDFVAGEDNYAVRHENGTGTYLLQSRDPEVRSVLTVNPDHWAEKKPAVTKIEYLTIADPATRSAALMSGEVDLILDLPVQDIERLSQAPGLKVVTGPENRVIYFGYKVEGPLANAKAGENSPFSNPKVREAVELAINREAIQKMIMRGQSGPTDVVAPPFINGWSEEIAKYPAADQAGARALLAEAGYADGFSVTLDTPNNRYVNDEAIGQAVAGMLGQVGIKVNLMSRPMSQHSQIVHGGKSDFYLLGWGVPTYDAAYVFSGLMHSKGKQYGLYNMGGYANQELDALIEKIDVEVDVEARNALIANAWNIIQADRPFFALHTQYLAYAMRKNIHLNVHPGDMPRMYTVTFD